MTLRSDYGYRNLPFPDDTEMRDLASDGIWRVDYATGQKSLIVVLGDLIRIKPIPNFGDSLHKINHVMISPDGEKFIFIHRWYHKGRRFDRLLLFRNNKIEVLADDSMVSHMCWINNDTVFGYLRYNGIAGFYFIDLQSGITEPCKELETLNNGDGHPSCYKDWIIIDSYPDKSRMQHLTLFNYSTKKSFLFLSYSTL